MDSLDTKYAIVTPNDIQSTLGYGYIYPEQEKYKHLLPEQRSEAMYTEIEQQYSTSSFFTAFRFVSDEDTLKTAAEALGIGVEHITIGPATANGKTIRFAADNGYEITPDTYQEWIVNLAIDKYALGGTATILFFL